MSEGFVSPPIAATDERILTTGRRNFLRGMLGVGAVLVVDGWRAIDGTQDSSVEPSQGETQKQTSQPDTQSPASETSGGAQDNQTTESAPADEGKSDRSRNPITGLLRTIDQSIVTNDGFGDTIADSLVATAGVFGWSVFANNSLVRLYSGNSGSQEIIDRYKRNKLNTLFSLVVVAPVAEETIFRGIPAIGGGTDSLMPFRGIASTYAFGKVHQLKADKKEPDASEKLAARILNEEPKEKSDIKLDPNKVPVPQYALGAYLWMVARRKGIAHSIVAHATTNAVVSGFLEIGSRTGSNNRSAEIVEE